MPESANDKLAGKIDQMTGQMQQVQVDLAKLVATMHGDNENIKLRVTSLETWRDSFTKTFVGICTGLFLAVAGAVLVAFVQGKFHG